MYVYIYERERDVLMKMHNSRAYHYQWNYLVYHYCNAQYFTNKTTTTVATIHIAIAPKTLKTITAIVIKDNVTTKIISPNRTIHHHSPLYLQIYGGPKRGGAPYEETDILWHSCILVVCTQLCNSWVIYQISMSYWRMPTNRELVIITLDLLNVVFNAIQWFNIYIYNYTYVCMYVFMYVCMHVRTYVIVRMYLHNHTVIVVNDCLFILIVAR